MGQFFDDYRVRHEKRLESIRDMLVQDLGYARRDLTVGCRDESTDNAGSIFANPPRNHSVKETKLDVYSAVRCFGLRGYRLHNMVDTILWFWGYKYRGDSAARNLPTWSEKSLHVQKNVKLVIGAVFPKIRPVWSELSGQSVQRFEGILEYSPEVEPQSYLSPNETYLDEFGLTDPIPNGKVLADILEVPQLHEIAHVVGNRLFLGTDTVHSRRRQERVATHHCRFVTAVSTPASEYDDALIQHLVPPGSVLRNSPSPITAPCVAAYFLREDGSTETRFAFLRRETGKIISFGILSSSLACPFQHPCEFVRSIDLLFASLRNCA